MQLIVGVPQTFKLVGTDPSGNPDPSFVLTNDGWATADPSIVSVTPSADGSSATFAPLKAGSTTETVTATNTAGQPLTAQIPLTVIDPPATGITIVPDASASS